jgi:hypothetical protein
LISPVFATDVADHVDLPAHTDCLQGRQETIGFGDLVDMIRCGTFAVADRRDEVGELAL